MIRTSVFELFKIGPGPSSSHTIGPMKAGHDFLQALRDLPPETLASATGVEATLLGSLSATGKGHGTDRAVVAGLLGTLPEECSFEFLDGLLREPDTAYALEADGRSIRVLPIVFGPIQHDRPFGNTLLLRLLGPSGALFEREYYSVGGGFIHWRGEPDPILADPAYPYCTMTELKTVLRREELQLHELILANERAITGATDEEIYDKLDRIAACMEAAVDRGLQTRGPLPGSIGLQRKAPILFERAQHIPQGSDRFLVSLNAYAFAASEENAAGRIVATAPTSGSSGVIPAVLYALKHHLRAGRDDLRTALLACSAIGFLAKHNASIAGADVGCQGEIGVASAMAAAMLAYANGWRFWVAENAAETALEHHLGLTCDPVGGFVQIPCIERNAMGAVKAYNAYLIATVEDPEHHLVGLDKAIRAMAETGRDMSGNYKETSLGGLALSVPEC